MKKIERVNRGQRLSWKREVPYLWFLLPALVMYTIFSIFPTISAFRYSFTNWDGFSPDVKFVWFSNFKFMLIDTGFKTAIRNTLIFLVIDVVLQNLLGLAAALLLESNIRTKNTLRGLFFIPVVLPAIVVSFLWTYIYGFNGGVLNIWLENIGLHKIDFIGDGKIAIYFVILAGVWQWVTYRTVIYISGIQGIPMELYESASIDGAGKWVRLKNITIPLLRPAFKINVVLCAIGALKQFDVVFTMTKGGPGDSTQVIATKIFKEAFSNSDYGYGCAIGVVLFFVIMLATLALNKYFDSREVEM